MYHIEFFTRSIQETNNKIMDTYLILIPMKKDFKHHGYYVYPVFKLETGLSVPDLWNKPNAIKYRVNNLIEVTKDTIIFTDNVFLLIVNRLYSVKIS